MKRTPTMASRIGAFKRVLAEAAEPSPLSPAFTAYRAATNDAERRTAYAALTQTDRDALLAGVGISFDAQNRKSPVERRAEDAVVSIARLDTRNSAMEIAERSRTASLPPSERRRGIISIIAAIPSAIYAAITTRSERSSMG
jgi:hypothetical protein